MKWIPTRRSNGTAPLLSKNLEVAGLRNSHWKLTGDALLELVASPKPAGPFNDFFWILPGTNCRLELYIQVGFPVSHTTSSKEGMDQIVGFESAVQKLADEGIVDPGKVGIIGFSRTVYHVDRN